VVERTLYIWKYKIVENGLGAADQLITNEKGKRQLKMIIESITLKIT